MSVLFSNNASTTVAGSITATDTTVTLAAGTGVEFPNPTGADYFVATFYDQATKTINEIVHVTHRNGDICTIARAQEGTTAQAWNAGDIFANLVTAGTLQSFVQAGTGAANTSMIYAGTDTSATPSLIVANTNPVPSSYAVGMQFNIKVANTNTGPVNVQFNGLASVAATRTDGSPCVGGNITAGEEYLFVYNGTNFTIVGVQPIPSTPPQNVFYVRTDGNDGNNGFANTPQSAFLTVYGAMAAIKQRYISQGTITIRVADGFYNGGFYDTQSYIASWYILGNSANPGNVVINATSLTPPPGSLNGSCVAAGGVANMTVEGLSFQSYYENVGTWGSGNLQCKNCHYTSGTIAGGWEPIACSGGTLSIMGTNQYAASSQQAGCMFGCAVGSISIGYQDAFQTDSVVFNLTGTVTFNQGCAVAYGGGTIGIYDQVVSFTGSAPTGPRYQTYAGGGIIFQGGNKNIFPGTANGIVTAPGWTDP